MYCCFYESKEFLGCLMYREEKKTKDGENVFLKAIANNFFLTSKSCSWPTFYQMDFGKKVMKCQVIILYY